MLMAHFRQAGSYQAFVDTIPPTINAVPANLSKATRIVFTPTDNFNAIKNFRAEVVWQERAATSKKHRRYSAVDAICL